MFGIDITDTGLITTRSGVQVGGRFWDHRLACWVRRVPPSPTPPPELPSCCGSPRDLVRGALEDDNVILAASYLAQSEEPIHSPMKHTCSARLI